MSKYDAREDNKYEERQYAKERRVAYREMGKRVAFNLVNLCRKLKIQDNINIKVADTANVHPMVDGAFVDAVIWIPQEMIDEPIKTELPTEVVGVTGSGENTAGSD